MKRETLKEIGKYIFDICKILFAIAFLTPMVKSEPMPWVVVPVLIIASALGVILINKGAKDD